MLVKSSEDNGLICSNMFENRAISFYFTNNCLNTNQTNGLLLHYLMVLNLLPPYISSSSCLNELRERSEDFMKQCHVL